MMRRWGLSIALFVVALFLGASALVADSVVWAVVLFLVFGAIALIVSPRSFPRSVTDAEARSASAADGRPIVYWRPGCPYCLRLRASLGRDAKRLLWVDIWADPDGAASVRAVADGNETVPTVIAGGAAMVNPSPERVRELARSVRS